MRITKLVVVASLVVFAVRSVVASRHRRNLPPTSPRKKSTSSTSNRAAIARSKWSTSDTRTSRSASCIAAQQERPRRASLAAQLRAQIRRRRNRAARRPRQPPPAGAPNGLTHDSQTEGYYIVSGGGTMVTGGRIVNGRRSAPDSAVTRELNGPSCSGPVVGPDMVIRDVKVGDIIIIPPNTVHGWVTIPDHVDYLSFRPSPGVLTAGYVHPSIKK